MVFNGQERLFPMLPDESEDRLARRMGIGSEFEAVRGSGGGVDPSVAELRYRRRVDLEDAGYYLGSKMIGEIMPESIQENPEQSSSTT